MAFLDKIYNRTIVQIWQILLLLCVFFRIDEHGNQVAKGFSWNHCIYENNKKNVSNILIKWIVRHKALKK